VQRGVAKCTPCDKHGNTHPSPIGGRQEVIDTQAVTLAGLMAGGGDLAAGAQPL